MEIEINGYDETGTIGKDLRFIRVGLSDEVAYRPFIYNILHFGSVSVSKSKLKEYPNESRKYLKMVFSDPALSISHYVFPTDHQIEVLRRFSLFEQKKLYAMRGKLIKSYKEEDKTILSDAIKYLKRYERTPQWMEWFVKSYGFNMIFRELPHTSKLLRDERIDRYIVVSQVDGGYPFVFWWRTLLSSLEGRFSEQHTPVYGITNGDEYYPAVSMAGNIATITNTVVGAAYPHNVREIKKMSDAELGDFYNEYANSCSVPTFHTRLLFVGDLDEQFQHLLPFTLHMKSLIESTSRVRIYEPMKIKRSMSDFYKTFGDYHDNDVVVIGSLRDDKDRGIVDECEEKGLEVHDCSDYFCEVEHTLDNILNESEGTNLDSTQRDKITSRITNIKKRLQAP